MPGSRSKRRRDRRPARLLVVLGVVGATAGATHAQETPAAPARPAILFNRWQEDWSVLANPGVTRETLDSLKYIDLSPDDPKVYLSIGAGLRERFESSDAASFGTGPNRSDSYLISRAELSADLRLGAAVQVFAQLQSDQAVDKTRLALVDRDRLDLEQAFVVVTEPVGGGQLRVRLGRQQLAFDLQRFVSVRDGPNVRQSYDAAWADYEKGPWRITGFYSQPVQNRDEVAFDDYSSGRLTYGGLRVERRMAVLGAVSVYLSRFTQDGVTFPSAKGDERRDILDVRVAGAARGYDWDVEAMGQEGRIGSQDVRAWAFGSLGGYTLRDAPWTPRLGLQVDGASGDRNPHDRRLETFNPLFPNGYYVTLAGYTGYVNFIHVKPSLTLHPTKALKLMVAGAAQWRETTGDAVYTQPDIPVANTAGRPGRYTGSYGQVRADWAATPHVSLALEAVHFTVGGALQRAGGHDANYFGLEAKYGW